MQGSPSMSNPCKPTLHFLGIISFSEVKHTNLIHITQNTCTLHHKVECGFISLKFAKFWSCSLRVLGPFINFLRFTFGDLNNLGKVMMLNLTLRICFPCSCRFSKGILYEFVCLCNQINYVVASLVAQSAKNLPAMQETALNTRDPGSFPGLGRSLGIGNSNPLQYSCLGNPMDREA